MTSSVPPTVDGPLWAHGGLIESGGLYPLRVEPPVSVLVELLLPGVITTTTQPRYYSLHAAAWQQANDEAMDLEEARTFVRRCEVVLAAIYRVCGGEGDLGHVRRVPAAHGAGNLGVFIDEAGDVDVAGAAGPRGMSANGFWGTYFGVEQETRIVVPGAPPSAGERAELGAANSALTEVLALARQDHVAVNSLVDHIDLCPCRTAEAADGDLLRRVIVLDPQSDNEGDRRRSMTCRMMLEALGGGPSTDPEEAFTVSHGFGPAIGGTDAEAEHRATWRAAILRNYSVSAWRRLWARVSDHLVGEPMTRDLLVSALVDDVGTGSVRELLDELPPHADDLAVLPAELQLLESGDDRPVRRDLQILAVGARRAEDLEESVRRPFLGHRRFRGELDPEWVARLLAHHDGHSTEALVHDVATTMLDRAARVAHSKMTLVDGRPYAPTRLRDRDGWLWMTETEGDLPVSLRGWTLAQVLCGLGVIDRDPADHLYRVSDLGHEMHDALRG